MEAIKINRDQVFATKIISPGGASWLICHGTDQSKAHKQYLIRVKNIQDMGYEHRAQFVVCNLTEARILNGSN